MPAFSSRFHIANEQVRKVSDRLKGGVKQSRFLSHASTQGHISLIRVDAEKPQKTGFKRTFTHKMDDILQMYF